MHPGKSRAAKVRQAHHQDEEVAVHTVVAGVLIMRNCNITSGPRSELLIAPLLTRVDVVCESVEGERVLHI